jgi:hypothetical protein
VILLVLCYNTTGLYPFGVVVHRLSISMVVYFVSLLSTRRGLFTVLFLPIPFVLSFQRELDMILTRIEHIQ